jgi:iron complex outermembrane receptor protein
VTAIWLAVAAGPVAAREPGRSFDIPAQDGASALNAFAAQSGLNILFPYRVAAARQSRAIQGELPPKRALQQLLDDTGLRIVRERNGVITLGERRQAFAAQTDPSSGSAPVPAPPPPMAAGARRDSADQPARSIAAPPLPPLVAKDIIVTAQRRAERLENAPASILLLGGPELQAAGVKNFHDLAVLAPGVQISNFGIYSQPAIRGISTTFAQVAQETNVAVYVDGFYNADQLSTNQDFASIQDIQILKGPQGTLYGRNATGGAILITTRGPTDKLTADGYLSYAPRFDDRAASLFLAGPLAERIRFSIAGYYRESDGYKRDVNGFASAIAFDDTSYSFPHHHRRLNWARLLSKRRSGRNATPYKNWSVRPKLEVELSDRLKVTFGYVHMFINEPRTFAFTHVSDLPNTAPAYNGYPVTTKRDKTSLNFRPTGITRTDELNAIVEWKLGDLGTLTARTAYRRQSDFQVYDLDGTPADPGIDNVPMTTSAYASAQYNRRRTWTQGLDYNGTFGSLSLLAGLFYYHDDAANVDGFLDTGAASGPAAQYISYNTRAWAAYLDATYALNDRLFVTLGGRFAHDRRSLFAARYSSDGSFAQSEQSSCYTDGVLNPLVNGVRQCDSGRIRVKKNAFTPRFVLRYNLAESTNVYGSITRGFKAAAINGIAPFNTLKPETVTAYELGFKTVRGAFRGELAGFYYDYKNNQLSAFNANIPGSATLILNAGGSQVYGLDANLSYRFPGAPLNLRLGLEWLHARYTDLPNASNTTIVNGINTSVIADWSGRRLVRAPDFSGSLSADYTMPLLDGDLVLSGTLSFSSRYAPTNASFQCNRVSRDANGQDIPYVDGSLGYCSRSVGHKRRGRFEENGYVLLNGQLAWTDPSRRYTLAVFGHNITGTRYKYLSRGLFYGTDNYFTEPRTFGVRLGVKL